MRSASQYMVLCVGLFGAAMPAVHADDVQRDLQELRQTNAVLQTQLREQKDLIETLSHQMADLQQARKMADLKEGDDAPGPKAGGFDLGRIHFSGEAGVGFFKTGSEGAFPNSEFRLDEAKLFLDMPIVDNVYAFGELNLAQREYPNLDLNVGEFYLDFEDVSLLWGHERQLNVRAGRLDIPFGEEYLTRDAIDNPLISHSLTDFWGVDEGVELYGALGKFNYVVAVQNGDSSDTRDFTPDKSVVARLGFDPTRWLHFGMSAMRTGDLSAQDDQVSAIWFGSGYFRSIGSTNTTRFHADLLQGDVAVRWARGHLSAFGGAICYDDNDPNGSNRRQIYFYSIEAQQRLTQKLYVATRFSQIIADKGFPIVGNGDYTDYFYNSLTKNLWRASLGIGYRWSDQLTVKAEYTVERGQELDGKQRNHEDMLAVEAAIKF